MLATSPSAGFTIHVTLSGHYLLISSLINELRWKMKTKGKANGGHKESRKTKLLMSVSCWYMNEMIYLGKIRK